MNIIQIRYPITVMNDICKYIYYTLHVDHAN